MLESSMHQAYSALNTGKFIYLRVTKQTHEEAATEAIEEDLVVRSVIDFINGAPLPQFLRGLPGAAESPPAGMMRSRLSGQPVLTGIDARRETLRADAAALARGKLSRPRRKEIAEQADRVTVEIRGSQRRMRPAFLRFDDAQAVLGYVFHLIVTREYGQRLARCKLSSCPRFFLREARQARPESYCSAECAAEGKRAASKLRSQDSRNRRAAMVQLRKQYGYRAPELVRAVAEPRLSVDELVRRASLHAVRKHK